ncbi:MAG: hypothetical protein AB1758_20210 [Candidatus Eremiobacterota bacterium]
MPDDQQGNNPVANLIEGLRGLLESVESSKTPPPPQDTHQPVPGAAKVVVRDRLDEFQEVEGDGQCVVRNYEDGTTRTENVVSGVILEERPDGSLYVSLAEGRFIRQGAPGEPLLAFDTVNGGRPRIAQVSRIQLDPSSEPVVMMHFEDEHAIHLVQLDTLRYFRINRPPKQ